MPNFLENLKDTIFSVPAVSSIRRNHGLEHATLHILSERFPGLSLAGHSSSTGFWLLGDVPTEAIRSAVDEALQRMRAGEHNLAVHANCGTNFVTAGTVAGLAGAAAMFGVGNRAKDKIERLPLAASLATIGLILAQPLGMLVQERITTSGHPGNLQVVDIKPSRRGNLKAHRVSTRG